MKRHLCLILTLAFSLSSAFAADATQSSSTAPMKDPCTVTCYEKSPTCYVTADGPDCLTISNEKPVCTKGTCVCTIQGCETKTTLQPSGSSN